MRELIRVGGFDRLARVGLALALALLAVAVTCGSAAAASCPNTADPTADYSCPLGPKYVLPGLADVGGWDQASHYQNILYGDLTGHGTDEMVARGPEGIEVYRFDHALGQWTQLAVPPILPDRSQWNEPQYYRTMALGDIDGDGKAELVIRGPKGMIVFRYDRLSETRGKWVQVTESGPFSDAEGWFRPLHYGTIRLSPIGAQGPKRTMQLIGRARGGLAMYHWNGHGWSPLAELPALSDQDGFSRPEFYSTIKAWDRDLLLARDRQFGFEVFRYAAHPPGPGPGRSSPTMDGAVLTRRPIATRTRSNSLMASRACPRATPCCWRECPARASSSPPSIPPGGPGRRTLTRRALPGVRPASTSSTT